MKQVNDLIAEVLEVGIPSDDRTGTGTISVFGRVMRFDLSKGFPAVTCKKLAWKSMLSEFLWFIRGSDNLETLREILHGPNSDKKTIWDANWDDAMTKNQHIIDRNEEDPGYMGPIYGNQWRFWKGKDNTPLDQLKNVIEEIKTNPTSRRLIVSAWNPTDLEEMTLPPCHILFQFRVLGGKLHLSFNMR